MKHTNIIYLFSSALEKIPMPFLKDEFLYIINKYVCKSGYLKLILLETCKKYMGTAHLCPNSIKANTIIIRGKNEIKFKCSYNFSERSKSSKSLAI